MKQIYMIKIMRKQGLIGGKTKIMRMLTERRRTKRENSD